MGEKFSETDVTTPKRSRTTKILLLVVLILVCMICVQIGYYYSFNRPFTGLNAMAVVEPDAYSRDVDYKTVYNESQTKAYLPAKENGVRALLAALGPDLLATQDLGRRIPWEKFPTNEESKNFFENTWTPICEIYELDPKAKPTMYGRFPLRDYLIKYGIKGDETSLIAGKPAPAVPDILVAEKSYVEDGQYFYGVLDGGDLFDAENRLASAPWTAEEFPVAARWFEENADYFDLITEAVRQPKFGCWHTILEEKGYCGISYSNALYLRRLTANLGLRANYRLGKGDVSGALEDFESMTLIVDSVFQDENVVTVHYLRGIATGNLAMATPMERAGFPGPTVDECRRVVELVSKYTQGGALDSAFERCVERERFFAMNAIPFMLNERRHGKLGCMTPLLARPINDEKVIRDVYKLWEDTLALDEADRDEVGMLIDELLGDDSVDSIVDFFSGVQAYADRYALRSLAPALAMSAALRRFEATARLKQIAAAILAYEADHGAFPPAFSVDASGKPLLSWRVLILPYLGEDAKALYEEFALDEPWDSEHNRPLLKKIPDVYRRFSDKEPGTTRVAVLLGKESFFDASGVGKKRADVSLAEGGDPDRLALLMTAKNPVPWTEPNSDLDQSALRDAYTASLEWDATSSDGPLQFLAQTFPTDDLYASADGAVGSIPFDERGSSVYFEPTLFGKSTVD
ncbi:MAG: DUF1559 domain-containing protein [Thermoguttaceae bacterium]|jgi:hypothetical protein